jgi:hypothetical protein
MWDYKEYAKPSSAFPPLENLNPNWVSHNFETMFEGSNFVQIVILNIEKGLEN